MAAIDDAGGSSLHDFEMDDATGTSALRDFAIEEEDAAAGAPGVVIGEHPLEMCSFHEFVLRHPLVEVSEGRVSKFEDGRHLDPQVCSFLLRRIVLEMQRIAKCYAPDATEGRRIGSITRELNFRPVASALFPIFTSLAPAAGELLDGEDPEARLKDPFSSFEQTVGHVELKRTSDDELASSFMSDGRDMTGWSFADDCFTHEESGTTLKPHQAVDIRGYVIDMNLPGQPRLPRSIFEMKAQEIWPLCLHHALYHGCAAAMQNVQMGRYKKIHLVVLGIGWVGAAEIDPVACLEVAAENKISLKSVEECRKQILGKCKYLETKGKTSESQKLKDRYCSNKSDQELKEALETELKNNMGVAAGRLNASAAGPGSAYTPLFFKDAGVLLGKATYRLRSYSMLRFPLEMRSKSSEDDRIVVSGIARIIFGNRALKWTLETIQELAARRQQEADAEADAVLQS